MPIPPIDDIKAAVDRNFNAGINRTTVFNAIMYDVRRLGGAGAAGSPDDQRAQKIVNKLMHDALEKWIADESIRAYEGFRAAHPDMPVSDVIKMAIYNIANTIQPTYYPSIDIKEVERAIGPLVERTLRQITGEEAIFGVKGTIPTGRAVGRIPGRLRGTRIKTFAARPYTGGTLPAPAPALVDADINTIAHADLPVNGIYGVVTDAITGKAVENCRIEIAGKDGNSNPSGAYKVDLIPTPGNRVTSTNITKGKFKLKATKAGYHDFVADISLSLNYPATNVDIQLIPKSVDEAVKKVAGKLQMNEGLVKDIWMKEWDEVKADLKRKGISDTDIENVEKNRAKVHAGMDKWGKKLEEGGKKAPPKIKLPSTIKKPLLETGRVFGGLVNVIIGFMISAILGIPTFVFAFLCFAVYIVMPGTPDVLESVRKNMEKIREKFEGDINAAMARGDFEDAEKIQNILNGKIEAARSIGEWRKAIPEESRGLSYAVMGMKEFFKMLGIVLLISGIAFSGFPMAALVAMIASFVAYFSFSVGRTIKGEEKK